MALYALSDLHLSFQADKPMDMMGSVWKNHVKKIEKNWLDCVSETDTIVLGGDHSWGKNLAECEQDLQFIMDLPGRKILLRGNHDMFWDAKKTTALNKTFEPRLHFLQNNFYSYGEYALVGTKGYIYEGLDEPEHAAKLMERELERLQVSFEAAKAAGYEKFIMFLHYPPTSMLWPGMGSMHAYEAMQNTPEGEMPDLFFGKYADVDPTELPSGYTEMAEAYGAEQVIYGHSHGQSRFKDSIQGDYFGVHYRLVSGDYLNFKPVRLL